MDIEVKLLRSFITIYEKGSLSRAAEKLACTQAAMSMRLKLLESEIGEPLFHRQHHKLDPTFKGTEFYARALSVLAAYDEMISATRANATRVKIRIGVPDDYAIGILPNVFSELALDSWGAEVEIICDLSANLVGAMQRREIDLALVTLAAKPSAPLCAADVTLSWVFHPDIVLSHKAPVSLAAYPEGCVFRRAMIASLEASGKPWQVVAQSRNHAGIVSALHGKLAVSAMARGTAPAGLVEASETNILPRLDPVPIYLLGSQGPASKQLTQCADAIATELHHLARRSAICQRRTEKLLQ